MVSIEKIREEMQKRLSIDSELHHVEVNASTIDEALADASVQLDMNTSCLEYEVVERGSNGFLGIGKKPWKLRIYQNPESIMKAKAASEDDLFASGASGEATRDESRDGLFYVRRFGSSIMLKVLLPVGKGRPIDEKDVLALVQRADTEFFDQKKIEKFLKKGTDEKYEEIGLYKHISASDASISVDISKDEMHGTIVVDPPAMSGADVSAEQIEAALKAQGIVLEDTAQGVKWHRA